MLNNQLNVILKQASLSDHERIKDFYHGCNPHSARQNGA
ncbi:hypothetical protein H1P_2130014 [Hyella patelloides LEGE 07179]|uniref:Uncharacterized protein n=1 Tax=Hyella patelloides LEGE 07179 TaxID=945734 RepID=A0A563VQP1_9CYAN|nr:hypothetical protein H1P_2130014 [Hyella patelloides LEGE 07179]